MRKFFIVLIVLVLIGRALKALENALPSAPVQAESQQSHPATPTATPPVSQPVTASLSVPDHWIAVQPPLELTILKVRWSISQFSVATWQFRVRNEAQKICYKDLHFKTRYYGPSGTLIDESLLGHTEYQLICPGQTKTITFTEFAHSQAETARIDIDQAFIWGH